MNKKAVSLSTFSAFLLSAMVATALAQPRTVGVTVGDWFEYGDITSDWSSNDPNATTPIGFEYWELFEEMEWARLSVEQVSDTNITFLNVVHYRNDTEDTSEGSVDVDTGEGDLLPMAISANLEPGDTLYTSGMYSSWTINETELRTYPDYDRYTNHVNMTYEFSIWGSDFYMSINQYWDKETGIIVEISFEWENRTGEYLSTWQVSYRISDSNVWVIPEFPTWASILVAFAILTAPIIIYKRRRLQTSIH